MKKERQKALQKWLGSQQKIIKKSLYLNVFLGTLSAFFMIGQMWLLARILHKMMIEHQGPSAIFGELGLLLLCFAGRALCVALRERVGFQAGRTLRTHLRGQIIDKLKAIGAIRMQQKPAEGP